MSFRNEALVLVAKELDSVVRNGTVAVAALNEATATVILQGNAFTIYKTTTVEIEIWLSSTLNTGAVITGVLKENGTARGQIPMLSDDTQPITYKYRRSLPSGTYTFTFCGFTGGAAKNFGGGTGAAGTRALALMSVKSVV